MDFLNNIHVVTGLDPVADAFAGTVTSDIVNLEAWHRVAWLVYWGVGVTGTTTITVEASDDVSASNVTAVAFTYRRYTSADTAGAITAAAAAGFTTTAGSSQRYLIEIEAQKIASTGYGYARISCVEVVDSPLLGGIMVLLGGPRYGQATPATAVV